jgi:hypothetical protein
MASITGIVEAIAGAAAIAAGIIIAPLAPPLSGLLISAGVGLVLNGTGTLIAGDPVKGFATVTCFWR